MNELKRFDRPQLMIGIIGIACFINSIILFLVMFLTATVNYDSEGHMESLTYNPVLQSLYSIFALGNILALTWFVIRLVTFRMRKKEYDAL